MMDDDKVHRTREKRKDFEEKMQEESQKMEMSWRSEGGGGPRREEEGRGRRRKHGDRGLSMESGVGRGGRVLGQRKGSQWKDGGGCPREEEDALGRSVQE